ncbi:MAG: glycosyltransferase family 2 protein [Tepidisphaeraceae bacterium]
MPKVSVILPAYNSERYIGAAVQSILDQTFGDFEFIIVNDGSTDGTEAILRKFAGRDSRIKLISRPNTGYVRALNEAAEHASGTYVARMDGDDIALPERFARQVAYLDAHPEAVIVGTSYDLIDHRGRRLRTQHQPTDDAALQRDCLAGTTPLCHPTTMFRRSSFEQAGRYDEAFYPAEDLNLWLRLGEIGQLACLPDVLLRYRLHAGSVSETKQTQQVAAARRACEAAGARRGVSIDFKAGAGWREIGKSARLNQTMKYGWWAFESGERATAHAYGWSAVRQCPWSAKAWRLLLISYVRRPGGV